MGRIVRGLAALTASRGAWAAEAAQNNALAFAKAGGDHAPQFTGVEGTVYLLAAVAVLAVSMGMLLAAHGACRRAERALDDAERRLVEKEGTDA